MRTLKRFDEFYEELCDIHKKYFPDWRFGQMITNVLGWYTDKYKRDIFFPDEAEMLQIFNDYLKKHGYVKEEVNGNQ